VVASAERAAIEEPLDASDLRTDTLGITYEPFEDRSFDGDAIYATDGGPERDVAVLSATNRMRYRVTYRGTWAGAAAPVNPELQRLRELNWRTVRAQTTESVG
jgi:hypothetical protein